MDSFKNPAPAVDAVIFYKSYGDIILIRRKNPPHGLALPGGFVNEGESLETAVKREVKEELSIDIFLLEQFHTYSDPQRDPRKHVMSTVFLATTTQRPVAADDAADWNFYDLSKLLDPPQYSSHDVMITPPELAFDHQRILRDVQNYLLYKTRPLVR